MKIAIISDVHSNLTALLAVIRDIALHKVDQIICLRDIVGYFSHPGECLDLLRYSDIPIHFIKGNHETLLRDERWQEDASNEMALAGIQHADSILSNEQYEFLQELPRSLNFKEWGIAVSHDCFHYPGIGHYILFCGQAEDDL